MILWVVAALAQAEASTTGLHCQGKTVALEEFQTSATNLLNLARQSVRRWLSPAGWPLLDQDLLHMVEQSGGDHPQGSQCEAEGALVRTMLGAYHALASTLHSWNVTALSKSEPATRGAAADEVLQAYGQYLLFHEQKAIFLQRFVHEPNLLASWQVESWEQIFGLMLRSAWLTLAPQRRVQQSHCACRDTPETQSLLFDAFDEVRAGYRDSFGLFQCSALQYQPDYSAREIFLEVALSPDHLRCLPAEIVIIAACSVRAAREQRVSEARKLLGSVAMMMALAADCFDHTPWTTSFSRVLVGSGADEPLASLSAAEVLYNWARRNDEESVPWNWKLLPMPSAPRGFSRPLCASDLGPSCVDVTAGNIVAVTGAFSGSRPAYLLQCADSYGEWRRLAQNPHSSGVASRRGKGWILHVSSLAVGNLWHLLHILLPALHYRSLQRATGHESHGSESESGQELLIDGLISDTSGAEEGLSGLPALRKTFAWHFLAALSQRPPILLGHAQAGQPRQRCYEAVRWGHEAVTLFGRDKGALSQKSARIAVAEAQFLHSRTAFRGSGSAVAGGPLWQMLLIERKAPARRAVINGRQMTQLLRANPLRRRADALWVDFASEEMRSDVGEQWRLASSAHVLLGAHGAGLSWAAFMAAGSVLVELMPHMRVLQQQLCRGNGWDSTPMYAYGGLALLTGLRHACVLGLPLPEQEVSRPSLGSELGTWWSSDIYVDIAAVNQTLHDALDYLDRSSR